MCYICPGVNFFGLRAELICKLSGLQAWFGSTVRGHGGVWRCCVLVVLGRKYLCQCYLCLSCSFNHMRNSSYLLDTHVRKHITTRTKISQWVTVSLWGPATLPILTCRGKNMCCLVSLIPRKQLCIVLCCCVILAGMWRALITRSKPRNRRLTLSDGALPSKNLTLCPTWRQLISVTRMASCSHCTL